MCTVSWLRAPGARYQLFFNRDERRTRAPEIPPAACETARVRFLAPRDAEAGGTWIAVNELGLTVCLLNGYRLPDAEDRAYTSRGVLVASLADAATAAEAAERLRRQDLTAYRSFLVAAVDPGASVVVEWDGRKLQVDADGDVRVPLVSSAFRQSDVRASRVAAFRALPALTPEVLEAFHRGHAGGRGSHSPCMHRPDASTRSMTHVVVGPELVRLGHTPGAPCRTPGDPPLRLPRRAAQSAPR